MKIQVQKINNLLSKIAEDTLSLTIIPQGSTEITLYQGRVVKNELSRYGLFCIVDFPAKWRYYVEEYTYNLYKMWSAINSEYNPIHNYDMTENGLDTNIEGNTVDTMRRGIKDSSGNWSDSKVTNTSNLSQTAVTSSYTSTYDEGLKLVNKTTTKDAGNDSDGNSSSQTVTNTMVYNDDYTNTRTHESISYNDNGNIIERDNINTHRLSRSGNIGVTTTQQMINSELELRRQTLLEWFICNFIAKYCWYAGYEDIEIEVES